MNDFSFTSTVHLPQNERLFGENSKDYIPWEGTMQGS